jgi:hypothetical protein
MGRIAVTGARAALMASTASIALMVSTAAVGLGADDKVGDKASGKVNDKGGLSLGAGLTMAAPASGVKCGPKGGLGLGPFLFAEMRPTDRQMLRGRLGYVHYGDMDIGAGELRRNLGSLRLEAEWAYSFFSNDVGPYVLGGVGAVNSFWTSARLDRSGDTRSGRHSGFNPFLIAGGGWAFGWFAVEHRRFFDFAGRPAGSSWEFRPVGGQR